MARLRARLGSGFSKPRLPEVREDAQGEEEPANSASLPPPVHRSSDAMFAAIGAQLRERREALNLTREEIDRHIHLRAHYLQALEEGKFQELPSAVQTRGMLSNYATFLDLDVDALLLEFADMLQVRHRERHPLPPGARGRPVMRAMEKAPSLRGFVIADLVAVALVASLLVFLIFALQLVLEKSAQAAITATADLKILLVPSSSATDAAEASTAELLDLGNSTLTPNALQTPATLPVIPAGVNVQVNLVAVERTFLRVIADGEVVFDGRVTPGTAYPFEAVTQIEVLTGNGAALRVTYNLRDMGLLGGYGKVVNLIYRADGVFNPTPTVGPTPTITPTLTIVPSRTQTPIPTRTP